MKDGTGEAVKRCSEKIGTGFGKWASEDHEQSCLTRIKGMPKRTLGNEDD